jgi:hypothetical protein
VILRPPIQLALAQDEREVPGSDSMWPYEPKMGWLADGWRALFTAPGSIQSKQGHEISHRFPEIVAAAKGLGEVVRDGERVALREGRLDISALQSVPRRRAAAGMTVNDVVFDLLALGERDVRAEPYRRRRERLDSSPVSRPLCSSAYRPEISPKHHHRPPASSGSSRSRWRSRTHSNRATPAPLSRRHRRPARLRPTGRSSSPGPSRTRLIWPATTWCRCISAIDEAEDRGRLSCPRGHGHPAEPGRPGTWPSRRLG